jgi:flagellar biosynthesis protein FliR
VYLQLLPVDQFQTFVVCTARVAGFLSAIPVYFSASAPARIKAGLTIALSLVLFPLLQPFVTTVDFRTPAFLLLIINETLLGLMIGLIARLIFTSVEFGGTIIGYQMGFAAANIFDPQNQRQTALISQFQNVFAILLFLSLDIHHYFIQTAVHSYELLPPGNLNFGGEAVPFLIELSSRMFMLGAQFSAPVLVILLLSGLILGVLARTFPQLNVFLLSFPLNIGISFVVIGLTLGLVKILLSREFDMLPERFFTLLRYLN